jgi:phosphohistidine phosphatase
MFLYLVQHAEAKKEEEDPARSLSEKGILDIGRVAACISRIDIRIDAIFHSNKLRARQTAEVLASRLTPSGGIAEKDGLSPLDDPKIWADRLKEMTGNVMLTGHQPHLGKLASLLLCQDEDKNIVSFRMAGVVCLGRDDSGVWSLQWMLVPGVICVI